MMNSSLLNESEKVLNAEAKRIVKELINMYHNKTIVNKSFSELINTLLKKKYQYYAIDLELRVCRFLPPQYTHDPNDKYSLLETTEATKENLLKYSSYCINRRNKDHRKAAQKLANILIEYYNKNNLMNKDLLELLADNMNKILPEHHDSMDSRAILLYLQNEIEKKGYLITSTIPFRLLHK